MICSPAVGYLCRWVRRRHASGNQQRRWHSRRECLHTQKGAAPRSKSTDARTENTITRVQWLSFAGFYQKKIIKDFSQSAAHHSLTGFLAHGKPAVACLEGTPERVHTFLRHVRTTVFATVPRNARKMTVGLLEVDSARRFRTFEAVSFFSQGSHHRPDMLDRKQLDEFLKDHGVPVEVRRRVGESIQ